MAETTLEFHAGVDLLPDDELVVLMLQKEEAALSAMIRRYGREVYAICRNICGDELEANGVVTEVFWDLWRNVDLFRPNRGSLRSYLLMKARCRAIDRKRSITSSSARCRFIDATINETVVLSREYLPYHQALSNEITGEIKQAICQLSILQQQTLQMAFFEGMSHREVAISLQIPLGTVKTHIRKGLHKLRYLLQELNRTGLHS